MARLRTTTGMVVCILTMVLATSLPAGSSTYAQRALGHFVGEWHMHDGYLQVRRDAKGQLWLPGNYPAGLGDVQKVQIDIRIITETEAKIAIVSGKIVSIHLGKKLTYGSGASGNLVTRSFGLTLHFAGESWNFCTTKEYQEGQDVRYCGA